MSKELSEELRLLFAPTLEQTEEEARHYSNLIGKAEAIESDRDKVAPMISETVRIKQENVSLEKERDDEEKKRLVIAEILGKRLSELQKLKEDKKLLLEYFKLTKSIVNIPEDDKDMVRLVELMEWINAYLRTEGLNELNQTKDDK